MNHTHRQWARRGRVAMWVLLSLAGLPFGEVRAAGERAEKVQPDFSLTLRPTSNEIVTFEPLLVIAVFRNESSDVKRVERQAYAYQLRFLSCPEGGRFETCAFSVLHCRGPSGALHELHPQEAFVWDELLFWRPLSEFGGQPFVFTKPGRYRVKAIMQGWESNTFQIIVKQPSAREQQSAIGMMRYDIARYIHNMMLDSFRQERADAIVSCDYFLGGFRDTPWADFVHYRLGQSKRSPVSNELQPNKSAYRHLKAVSNRNPALRRRAAYRQLVMLHDIPDLRTAKNVYPLKAELSKPCPEAEPLPNWDHDLGAARKYLPELEKMSPPIPPRVDPFEPGKNERNPFGTN